MGSFSLVPSSTAYGNSSWAVHNPMVNGGSTYDYKNRLTFSSPSGGKPITSCTFTFYKQSTNSGNYTWNFYATTDAGIVGNNIAAATFVGGVAWTRSSAGTVVLTFTQAMCDVIKQYTGTWYLLIDAEGPYQTTYTGGSSTNCPVLAGTYSDGSIFTNVGGVQRMGEPDVNVGGVWHAGEAWTNVGGVWRQGSA